MRRPAARGEYTAAAAATAATAPSIDDEAAGLSLLAGPAVYPGLAPLGREATTFIHAPTHLGVAACIVRRSTIPIPVTDRCDLAAFVGA